LQALQINGPTIHHRKSFAPVRLALQMKAPHVG
jgi:hypothetical protein